MSRESINDAAGENHKIAKRILRLDWYDTESQARTVIESLQPEIAQLKEQLRLERELSETLRKQSEDFKSLSWSRKQELNQKDDALLAIGNFAHEKSQGPAIEDALWTVRGMAYGAFTEAHQSAPVGKDGE